MNLKKKFLTQFFKIVHCNMGIGGETVSGLQGTFGSAVKAGHVDFYRMYCLPF